MRIKRKKIPQRLALVLCAGAAATAPMAGAQEAIEELVVFGRSLDLVGRAEAASEGSIGGADLLVRPMFKTAELLESMPGMVAVQHSGSGKANQYFLRGFNLDHGTDYTVLVDGVTLNLRSHGHGQGYLDVNGLIPEVVDRVDYRKGPYRADLGDFAMAGASFIETIDFLERDFVSMESGEYGWRRGAGGFSRQLADGALTLVGEYKQYDGPWERDEDLSHLSLWSKFLRDTRYGELAITLSGYQADWTPTEQIPERAVATPVCEDVFCALDPSAEGQTSRWIANAQVTGHDWTGNLYGQYYDWRMSSNPTYDFQISQFDRRWTLGGGADKTLVDGDRMEVIAGGNFRYDEVGRVGLDRSEQGRVIANIADNQITEASLDAFTEATWHAADNLRVIGGLRADYYDFDVTALSPGSNTGQDSDVQVSPKLALAYAALEDLEFYANWGKGFHSNDARGVVNEEAPVEGLSQGTGYEAGARASLGELKLTAAYWWLEQDSALIFVGDSNAVEPKGGSEREGLELTLFWQPLNWLGIDAVYTRSKARYTSNPEGSHVEGAVEEAAQFGISATRDDWEASLRMRYLGPYALVANNSRRANSLTTVNLRAARHWNSFTVYAEVINLLDTDGKEIVYYYPAYAEGLDPAGLSSETLDCAETDCRMSRTTVPESLRVGLSYKF